MKLSRRALLSLTGMAMPVLGSAVLVSPLARAQPQGKTKPRPKREILPALPVSLAVAQQDERPVVSSAWVARQLAESQRLLSPHGVVVELAKQRALGAAHAQLQDAGDRDALAAFVEKKVINVFVVRSLRDVDDPELLRMGVRWRLRRDLRKDYVILAASAMPTTLAHELGHFFGNGHSRVVNNIMSYERNDPEAVAFDSRQGAKMRRVAAALLASGKVAPYQPPGDDDGAS